MKTADRQAITIELKVPALPPRSTLGIWLGNVVYCSVLIACLIVLSYPPANQRYHQALDAVKVLLQEP